VQSIFLTGASGFVGTNLQSYLLKDFHFVKYRRNEIPVVKEDIVVHLAGKAHDTNKVAKPDEFYQVNTDFTREVFDAFLLSSAKVFIFISSVKAVADKVTDELKEDRPPHPATHYGKSKLLAEKYILSKTIPSDKRVYILRPCMIHGPGNKGNLNLLYTWVKKKFSWQLPSFENSRSFCSIENFCFIIKELITRIDIPSGIYNVSDNGTMSTNEIIAEISHLQNIKSKFIPIPAIYVKLAALVGDLMGLSFNSERFSKLSESYIVSNQKLMKTICKPLPVSIKEGLIKTIKSF